MRDAAPADSGAVPADSGAGGLAALFELSLEEWLRAADGGSGQLDHCRQALLRNFDSVEQIAELYLVREDGTLRPQLPGEFFRSVGVCDTAGRELLQATIRQALEAEVVEEPWVDAGSASASGRAPASPASAEPSAEPVPLLAQAYRSYSFAAWLGEVDDGSGALMQYLDPLDERYDSVEQVIELHGWSDGGGRCELDAAFFQGLKVTSVEHQWSFQRWCSERCVAPVSSLPPESSKADVTAAFFSQAVRGSAAVQAGKPGLAEGPICCPRPPEGHLAHLGSDFGRWLRLVGIPARSPQLSTYENAIRASMQALTVEQLVQQFLVADGAGGCALDCQLFHALGVELEEHRKLLEDWMLGGWAEGGQDSAEPCLAQNAGNLAADTASTGEFERWLLEVDPSGGVCDEYLAAITEHYDTPEQIVRLYTEALAPQTWSPLFFADLAVRPEHRGLFDRWLLKAAAAAPGEARHAASPHGDPSCAGAATLAATAEQAPGTRPAAQPEGSFFEPVD